MSAAQLELPFMYEDPDLKVIRAIERIDTRFENNRKALHAKNSAMQSKISLLEKKLEILESALCKGQVKVTFA